MRPDSLEIMAPAGNFECLAAAIEGGANSVYFGIGHLNMRSHSANNFAPEDLPEITRICREYGVRSYMTLNITLYDGELCEAYAVLDAAKLGRGFLVFCSVRLRRMGKEIANDFVNRVKDIPEVAECYNISGDFDYLLKIYAPDMQYYNDFLINTLGTIDSLGSVQSSFVMNEIKNICGLPL